MKVVAFNGSPRKNGNTGILIRYALRELKNEGIDTESGTTGWQKDPGLHCMHEMF